MADPPPGPDPPTPPRLDAFKLLGLPRRAWIDPADLARRFDALARTSHPDAGGHTDAFATLTEARSLLGSLSRRLRHLLELEAPGTTLDGPIPPDITDLFTRISPVLNQASALLARKAAASSAIGLALIARDECSLRETAESLAAQLAEALDRSEKAAAAWAGDKPDTASLAALARQTAFLEKWQAQVREALLKLAT